VRLFPRWQGEFGLNSQVSVVRQRQVWRFTIAIAGVLALLAVVPLGATQAASICSSSISSCGCLIQAPGFYQVTAPLSSTQGLTFSGDCIEVNSNGVVLCWPVFQ
jgi:hypothetical protein